MMAGLNDVLKILQRYQKFLVTTHYNLDADALCSVLATVMFLKACAKTVVAVNEDVIPQWLQFLPGSTMVKKVSDLKIFDYDAAIVLDCGDLGRIGEVKKIIDTKKPLINIDHHVTNDHFGSVNLVAQASSSSEIVFDLLAKARFPLNKNLATLLYAGIMTDTGSFRYENTNAHCHEIVSQLMKYKFSVSGMYDSLYAGIPASNMKMFAGLIHKVKFMEGNKVCILSMTQKEAGRFLKSFDIK
ncbi:MAG: DHH family phosphoesterase, partial [Candidatus Omnitrophica bacterium]|nr:DHH family phosphoesterase [Candidatus Omnitrophota bacterium]